jgi:hypothetical protein
MVMIREYIKRASPHYMCRLGHPSTGAPGITPDMPHDIVAHIYEMAVSRHQETATSAPL